MNLIKNLLVHFFWQNWQNRNNNFIFNRLLTGIEINSEDDMIKAMDSFHLKGVKIAVITSSNLGSSDFLFGFVSKINPTGIIISL